MHHLKKLICLIALSSQLSACAWWQPEPADSFPAPDAETLKSALLHSAPQFAPLRCETQPELQNLKLTALQFPQWQTFREVQGGEIQEALWAQVVLTLNGPQGECESLYYVKFKYDAPHWLPVQSHARQNRYWRYTLPSLNAEEQNKTLAHLRARIQHIAPEWENMRLAFSDPQTLEMGLPFFTAVSPTLWEQLLQPHHLEFKKREGEQWVPSGMGSQDLKAARPERSPEGGWNIFFEFTEGGSHTLAELSQEIKGQPLGVFVNGELISAPVLQEVITQGSAVISGNFTAQEAKELANKLQLSTLPLPPLELREHSYREQTLDLNALVSAEPNRLSANNQAPSR